MLIVPILSLVLPAAVQDAPDFAREVRPILARRCFACHGPDPEGREAGLRLDTRAGALALVVIPGDADGSELILRVSEHDLDARMPPAESGAGLSAQEVDLLRRWVEGGAEYARHWSFVPPERPAAPAVSRPAWVRSDIDAFVLSRLDGAGLVPSEEAPRAVLARRLALDLTGLPPNPEQVARFESDDRPDAYGRYVDALLASPHFGERWASVWLDVARYADSAGYGSDPLRTIWRYRDWVIDAFNANQPFDQFTRDQLAGDLLPDATMEQRLATAFHRNTKTNTEGGTDDEEFRVEAIKDRADTTMQAWMGLTFGCAKCHTHKYDPVTIEEYYSLFAFFNQTADTDKNNDSPRLRTPSAGQAERLAELDAQRLEVEQRLADPLRPDAVAAWAGQARERARSWRGLTPSAASAAQGTELTIEADGSVRAGGTAPERDTYTIEFDLPAGRWTGLALEVPGAEDLPGGGPGRSPGNGNFVLSDLAFERAPDPDRAAPVGRIVRFDLAGPGRILSLAEVQVFASQGEVARGKDARQSSTAFEGPAALAVDGNTSGVFTEKSVTHTATEADPWWEVDLGQDQAIERIVFWNRADGELHQRLDGVLVSVLDAERSTVWSGRAAKTAQADTVLAPAEWAQRLGLAEASADFAQEGWPAANALDADTQGTGWAIAPRVGETHRAVFALGEALVLDRPTPMRVRLTQGFGTSHTLGRLRLLATEYEGPVRVPPAEVSAALASLPECSSEQRALLAEHARRVDPQRASLRADAARLAKAVKDLDVVTTPVMEELGADRRRATHVLHKGNFLEPTVEVSAAVPAAFHPWPEDARRDRLGLSRWITDGQNPLTARVAVNRWWMTLFGRGLVETQEDFGSQGRAPSHPELLDWLAVEYVQSGWDTKALLRTIVSSSTYRQSSRVSPASMAGDPTARLLSRMPRVPLEAEQVRDQALAVAGLLSSRLHGPPIYPPQPDGVWQAAFNGQRSWRTSEGEDRYRRGIYVYWRRTAPYPSMVTFDAPSRELCSLRRLRTNTPLQAFVTLNDPVYVECAQGLARRMMGEAGAGSGDPCDPEAIVTRGFQLCLQRDPTTRELELLLGLYVDALTELAQGPIEQARLLATDPLGPLEEGQDVRLAAAWTAVAGVLLNLDEFLNRE